MLRTEGDGAVLHDLVAKRCRRLDAAAPRLSLLGAFRQQVAKVAVCVGVPRIRRDRCVIRRLRAVDVLPLAVQQEAEVMGQSGSMDRELAQGLLYRSLAREQEVRLPRHAPAHV